MSRLITKFLRVKSWSPVRIIVVSFLMIIAFGTILLMLPISSKSGYSPTIVNNFFIATSCTCVTGLTPFDTFVQWSAFGQAVILILIELGGLGLITFTTSFTLFLRKKLGFRDLVIAKEYTNGNVINMSKLIKTILFVSFLCQFVGTVLLSIRFVPDFGIHGIWVAIFTAVSAYCNAGFDIMGFINPSNSFIPYCTDYFISLTISMLVIIGGIGFIVIVDIYSYFVDKHEKNIDVRPKLSLHSLVVLRTNALLLFFGTVLFFIIEYDNTLCGFSPLQKLNISFFQSAVCRTAGFSTVSIGNELAITKIITIFLMFIGASPSSTGGGIKTTTLVVIIATVVSVLKGNDDTIIRHHKVDKKTVYKALSIVMLAIFVICVTTSIIGIAEINKGFSILDITFETVSAFGTVGLTTGITPFISSISKLMLCLTMFIGRVGPISLLVSLTMRHIKKRAHIFPEAKIIVG